MTEINIKEALPSNKETTNVNQIKPNDGEIKNNADFYELITSLKMKKENIIDLALLLS